MKKNLEKTEKLEQLIKTELKKKVKGPVIWSKDLEITRFATDKNYAIIFNRQAFRLITYEFVNEEQIKITSIRRYPDSSLLFKYSTLERAHEEAKKVEEGIKTQYELQELKSKELPELEENLIREKNKRLEDKKDEFVEKRSTATNKKEKAQKKLRIYLSSGQVRDSELTKLLNEICEKQQEITLLERKYESQILKEGSQIPVREENINSEENKALELQVDKTEVQIGFPTPDRTRLVINEQYSQSQQVVELGKKIVDQKLETQEQEQQTQQEVPPKGNN
ncbi:13510_t:CDS:2 [Funneliformis geosporum]|nr:13510_t:CDS:2 [Funneliformis geosporum]